MPSIYKSKKILIAGLTPISILIVLVVISAVVIVSGVSLDALRDKGFFSFNTKDFTKIFSAQTGYLDDDKISKCLVESNVVGTVSLPDGSYSAYKILNGRIENSSLGFANEAKLTFLSGDLALGIYKDGAIVPFYLGDGTKTVGVIMDRMVAGFDYEGVTYPVKIIQGSVVGGKLTGDFVGQTYDMGYIIAGKVDEAGRIKEARVTFGGSRSSEAESAIALNALSLFKKTTSTLDAKVLGLSTSLGGYQVIGTNKPIFDPKTGRWAFAGGSSAGGAVSTTPSQSVVNYLQALGQTGQTANVADLSSPNTIYQFLPTYLQQQVTTISGISSIKSGTSNLAVTTSDNVATLTLDLSGLSASVSDGSITSSKIADGTVTEGDLSVSNDPSNGQCLTYNSSTGAFTWSSCGTSGGSGTITGVTAGNGLSGGGTSGTVTLSASVQSSKGLSVSSSGLSLIQTCSDGELLKWTSSSSSWGCATDAGGAGGGISTLQVDDITTVSSATTLDFLGSDFDLTNSPTGEGNLSIDYTTSKIVRSDTSDTLTNKTISGASNTLSNIGNTSLTNSSVTINSSGILTGGGAVSLGGTLGLTATEADTFSSVTGRGASTATALTLSSASPITFSGTTPTITFSGGDTIFDLTGAATRTLSILNSTIGQVAGLSVEGNISAANFNGSSSGTNTGDNAANSNYASDYRAANFIAGTNYLAPNGSAASLTSFPTLNQNTTGTASNITGVLGASSFPAMTGDVTNTQGSLSTAIASGAVSLSKMANLAANSIIGNNTGLSATPIALTAAQVKTLLSIANTDVSGLGTISTQNANAVSITGGSINGTTVGATTAGSGAFTTLSASSTLSANGGLTIAANQNLAFTSGTGTSTQNYSNTTGTANTLNVTNSGSSGTNTVIGKNIAITGTINGTGSNTTTGINFANVAAATNNTYNALTFGTGFNNFFTSGTVNLTAAGALSGLTTLGLSGQLTSTVSTGAAPFVVASTTNVANLNASSLNGTTFAAPGSIGGGTPGSGAFTTLSATGAISGATATNTINGLIINSGALSGISTISTSSTINGATISGGTISGGTLSGTALTGTGAFTVNTTGNANGLTLNTATGASGNSGAITIQSGGTTTSGTSGNISIDVGAGATSNGTIGIGTANSGTITIGRSTQGITLPGFTGNNAVLYGTTSTGVLAAATTSTSGLCLISGAATGYVPTWTTCPGGGGSWSALSAPSADLSLVMAANHTTFTWGGNTGAGLDMFKLTDNATNTGTGYVLDVAQVAGSAAKPLKVTQGANTLIDTTSSGVLTLTSAGAATWGTTTGSLALQPAGAGTTANVQIGAGGGGSATPDFLVVDQATGALPAGTNGAIALDSTGKFNIYEGAWKVLCNKTDLGCGTGTGAALSAITAATTGNTINSGDNAQVWNWQLTTLNKTALSFGENVASTATGNPYILGISTLNTSTANPLIITAQGTANGVKVDTTGLLSAIGTGGIRATDLAAGTYANALTLSGATNSITAGTLTATGGTINSTSVGATTPSTGAFTTLSATGAISGATATNTINGLIINSGALSGITTINASGQITSTLATGTAPFVVASTTNVANLNASSLSGATFAAPGAIGGTTPGTGAFTTLSASSTLSANGGLTLAANQNLLFTSGTGTATQNYSNTTGTANTLNVTNSASSGTNTVIGKTIAITGTINAVGSNTTTGINFANVAAATNNTYNGITFGTGFNNYLTSGTVNLTAAGALSGLTTLGLSGAITGATATNTINGLIINSAALSGITTINASGQITSTLATGTAPFVVASTTNVANLNASSLNGATFAAPGAIGGGTPGSGAFTTLSASGQITSGFTGNNAVLYGTTGTGVLAAATTSTSGLCLVSGAATGYVPTWTTCPGGGGGIATVKEGGTSIVTSAVSANFAAADFIITDETAGQAGIAIDYANSKLIRKSDSTATFDAGIIFSTTGNTNGVTINTATGASGNSGAITIQTGGTSVSGTSGNVSIDVGAGAGGNGTVAIGGTNASGLTVGRATVTTTVAGTLSSSGGISLAANQGLTFVSGTGTLTQNYSNTTGTEATFNHTNSGASGTNTSNVLGLAITGTANAAGSNTITGINFPNVAAATNNTYNGITFGTGFNNYITSGTVNLTAAGALSGVTTLGLSGAITGATATNTINGIIINSGAVSGVSTLGLSGAITGATTTNTINGLIINSGALSGITTINASGQITSTLATGTAPFVVASTTNVANLNASSLNGATFAAPGAIGGTTPGSGAFTTLSATGAITAPTTVNTINGVIVNAGAVSAVSTLGLSGAITGATATNTINGLIINSGALSGATTLGLSGAIAGATATNTINGIIINSGAVSSVTTLGLSGAITGATATNTINGIIINSGAVSGMTTLSSSGDWTWTATTPTITINSAETFTVSDGTDNFAINHSANSFSLTSGTNSFTFDADTGPVYAGNARPTKRITLTPEYPGASLTGDTTSNIGTMTSDNTTAAGTKFRNYYKWANTQGTAQDYDIWISVPIPNDFSAMAATPTLSIDTYTSDLTNGTVLVTVYDSQATPIADCTDVAFTPTGAINTWETKTATTCLDTGTYTAGGVMTIKIHLTGAATTGVTQVSMITFDYLAKF